MRLRYACSSCKKPNYYPGIFTTRGDMQMKHGDEVRVNCNSCAKQDKKHLNKISAVPDNRVIIVALILGIISTVFLIGYVGLIATASFCLPIYAWKYELDKARDFNRYVIKR